MIKKCSKCNAAFECKVNDVANCHCSQVPLSDKTLEKLKGDYKDCLCASCLKTEHHSQNTSF